MLDFNNSDTPVQYDSFKERFTFSECVRTLFINLCNAGCNEADLTDQSMTANPTKCIDRRLVNSSSISGGVVCYNGTTAGSRAVYICNNGLVLMGNEARVCQNDGNWNGTIPQCMQEERGMCCSQFRSITAYRFFCSLSDSICMLVLEVVKWQSACKYKLYLHHCNLTKSSLFPNSQNVAF